MVAQIARAAPGTVKAARPHVGSSGGLGSTGPRRSASAAATSRVWREAQIPEQLIHPRPLFAGTQLQRWGGWVRAES